MTPSTPNPANEKTAGSIVAAAVMAGATIAGLQAQRWVMHPETATSGWSLYAVLATCAAVVVAWQRPAATSPPHSLPAVMPRRWLWLGLALASTIATTGLAEFAWQPQISLATWACSFLAASMALRGWRASPASTTSQPWTGRELLVLAALLLLAALARFSWIDTLPPYYFNDEPRVGAYILKALRGGEPFDPFRMGWNTWARLGIWAQGLFVPILGLDLTTLRMSSALFGTAAVGSTYLLGRELFGARLALLAALLFAIGRTGIDFSRIGVCHAQVMFLGTVGFWCWCRGVHHGSAVSYLWCGIALGCGIYSYNAGHILLPLWMGWVGLCTLASPRKAWEYRYGVVLVLAGFALATGTWFYYVTDHFTFQHNWQNWTHIARSRQVTGRLVELWQTQGLVPARDLLWSQAWLTWLGFTVMPDSSYGVGYRGGGMLDPIASPLFVLGLAVCFAARRSRYLFLLYWLLPTSIAGGVLTGSPPATWRLVGIVPLLSLIAALPLDYLLSLTRHARLRHAAAMALGITLLGASAWDNWRGYFIEFATSDGMLDSASFLSHDISRLPTDTHVLLVGPDVFLNLRSETFAVHFHDRDLDDVAEPGDVLPIRTPIGVNVTLVLSPAQVLLTEPLRALYPEAMVTDRLRRTTGELVYRMIHIDAAAIAAQTGLRRAETGSVSDPFAPRPTTPGPAAVSWHGQVFWPSDFPVSLELAANHPTRVEVAGVELTTTNPTATDITRPRGWLDITIEEQSVDMAQRPTLAWRRGDHARPLTRWDMRPGGETPRLRGYYERSGLNPLRTIEAALNMDTIPALHPPEHLPTTLPLIAHWQGDVFVPVDAVYEFRVTSSAPYHLAVDGSAACNLERASTVGIRTCHVRRALEAGTHEFHAWWDGSDPSLVSHQLFQVAWRNPGDDSFRLVPFTARR